MNFEQSDNNDLPLGKKFTRRDILRTSLGTAAAVGLTAGVASILPKFEEQEEKEKPVLVRVKEPMLSDDEFLETEDTEKSETLSEEEFKQDRDREKRESISWKEFKKIKPELEYREVVSHLQIENLKMPNDISKYGATTHEGKILRTLRYKNVTDAVESRYNLPPTILLAMIMEESTGVDLLPNAGGDGGFGLCHMQGSTAVEYGLKTFQKCNSLVCNGEDKRSCKDSNNKLQDHAQNLSNFMRQNSHDRKKLVEADERLNILLNIDAAGRMLATGIAGPRLKGTLSDLGPLRRAIARYAGAYNYKNYWKDICGNMKDLADPELIQKIENKFNNKNPNLKINGEKADFEIYLKKFQEQHKNYGLEEYKKLTKYSPNNSVAVLESYKKYI